MKKYTYRVYMPGPGFDGSIENIKTLARARQVARQESKNWPLCIVERLTPTTYQELDRYSKGRLIQAAT